MVELKDIDKALAAFLLENIQKKRGKPSYSDVAKALSTQLAEKSFRTIIWRSLSEMYLLFAMN